MLRIESSVGVWMIALLLLGGGGCSSSAVGEPDGAVEGDTIASSDGVVGDRGSAESSGDGGAADVAPLDECTVGEMACVEGQNAARSCEAGPQGARWSVPVPCEADTYCRLASGSCQPPTQAQLDQASLLTGMVDYIADTIGWIDDLTIDEAAAKQDVEQILFSGDESARVYYTAARAGLLAFPVGHLSIYSQSACGTDAAAWQDYSRLGACARPYENQAFIITRAAANNPLGLEPGDRITAIDGKSGEAMVEMVLRQPMCGVSSASDANRWMVAAASALGVLPKGTELTIVAPDGTERGATISSFAAGEMSCRDPFGRSTQLVAEATLRPDGVGVIRLTRFTPLSGFKGTTIDEFTIEMEQLKQAIAAEFAKLAGAKGIVWDLRGNIGGATPVGLAIVGGMPGVVDQTFIAHCKSRIPNSSPPQWYNTPGAQFDYIVAADSTFTHPAKVAVVIDGLAISAADYFALAVSAATKVPLVGSPTAGAFGGGGGAVQVSQQPDLFVASDPARCADGVDVALEGRAVEPSHPVEYDPQDLVVGKDSLLEAAAALVLP